MNEQQARQIMGNNFFGIEEAIKYYGVNPTIKERSMFAEIPFPKTVLEECKDTYLLFLVFPLSVIDICDKKLFYKPNRYKKEFFTTEYKDVGWHLVCKDVAINSVSNKWKDQITILGEKEEVPSAQVLVYMIIGHYHATGERLFERVYARTVSVFSDGRHVSVGYFDSRGLHINNYWNDSRNSCLGLASARRQMLNS